MEGRYNLKVSEFARSMGRAVDAAEGKRLGHAQCVSHLAFQLARQNDATPEELRDIVLAGLLHDVGWVLLAPELARTLGGSAAELLRKHPLEEGLLERESRLLRGEHVVVIETFLSALGLPKSVANDIGLMHECWDGGGVPDQLEGGQIPLKALILAVADHAVTLLDQSITEPSLSEPVLESLRAHAGDRLEPGLVDDACRWLAEGENWSRLSDVEEYEGILDEALYPLYGDFVDLHGDAVELWLDAIGQLADMYHYIVPDHSTKVRRLAGSIAQELMLSEDDVREVEIAAGLAEVGRVGLPLPLVFRVGPYSEDERELLRAYPTIAERILEPLRAVRPIFQAAITHREKLNGSGYPEGLIGDEIPIGARIISTADTFVALTNNNPQRPAYSNSVGVSIIQSEASKLFDQAVTDALATVIGRELGLRA